MLDLAQLDAFLDEHHHRDLYRVRTRERYAVASDGDDYHRFVAGEAEPTWSRTRPWLDHLRSRVGSGRGWRNVHVVQLPLSSYLGYACEWGYAFNVTAGQDVRIVETTDGETGGWLREVGDFWVVDGRHVVRMHYGDDDGFVGADAITDESTAAVYRAAAGLLWRASEPFAGWWAARPELHRAL